MATLIQLRNQVRNRIGVPLSDRFQSDDRIDEALQHAINTFESEHRWPWQENLVTVSIAAGDTGFDVPSDWMATRNLFIDDYELQQMAMSSILEWSTSVRGQPEVFGLVGDRIHLRSVSNAAYTVSHLYYRTAGDLINDTDTVRMPDQHTPTIIAKAAEMLSLREDDRSAAAVHLAEYLQGVVRARKEAHRITGPIKIRTREGSWIA